MGRIIKIQPEIYQTDENNENELDGNGEPIPVWKGWLEIEIPSMEKQTELKVKAASWTKKDGSFDSAESNNNMHEVAAQYLKACELEHVETKIKITDIEELKSIEEYEGIKIHIYRVCSRGPKLRNILRPK